ncbi:MAG: hypothetical protein KF758_02385 [Anaerolineales bacterium]|nr:hypothetical protein [Anaerolineales bacterium]
MAYHRIFVVIWLILSQLGGAVLALAPLLLAGVFGMLMAFGALEPFFWTIAFICGVLFTLFSLTIASWVAFFRKKDKVASILSGICLLIGVALYIGMEYLFKSSS